MEHLFNIQALYKKISKNTKPNLYQRINMLFKGAPFMVDKPLVKEIRAILNKNHVDTMKFLDEMEQKISE